MLTFLRPLAAFLLLLPALALAQGALPAEASYVSGTNTTGSFPLVAGGQAAPLCVGADDWPGVQRAARDVQADIGRVTGRTPALRLAAPAATRQPVVLVGTLGHSRLLDQLVRRGKLDAGQLRGKWEKFVVQAVDNPLPGVARALVVAGSDKRGTIYGLYDLSAQMGVSPWSWWADVPVRHQSSLYVAAGRHTLGEPQVKYRGIFLNDEAPALTGWAKEKFGGINSPFYGHVFELILRLRGNYLWPAMWGNAFNDDDQRSPELADEYGIVMGTSHHEPMLRAQQEWKRYGHGPWNYHTNDTTLRRFWRQGIRHMGSHESIVTIGMRGDGDEPMSQESNIALLEKIVADQRQLIAEETHRPAEQTPQLWALYKEVQDYYDQGMRVPDDVTLLLCDDNWGNLRKLPRPGDAPRRGGYGIYYHFDYVGGPRNYKWLNTTPLPRVWEQLHLAHAYGANQIWLVNVGDLKPLELPISFFLDYAWNPAAIGPTDVAAYTRRWAAQQFGPAHAAAIADLLARYAKYNGRRKPELLDADTYSLATGEWATVAQDYQTLATRAEAIGQQLPAAGQAAYYELVLHPVLAGANLYELYYTVARNRAAARAGQPAANELAARAQTLFEHDAALSRRYHALLGGKWNHMMDQTHIGYTSWQQPEADKLPAVQTVAAGTPATTPPAPAPLPPYAAFEAEHYTRAVASAGLRWQALPDLGRTLGAVTTFPVTAAATATPGGSSPHLEYAFSLAQPGPVAVSAYLAPTLDFTTSTGLRYAVSIDDEAPQLVNLHTGLVPDNGNRSWEQAVAASILLKTTRHPALAAGAHTLKFWRIDPGVVLEKLVLSQGELPATYLGLPEAGAALGPVPGQPK